VRCNGSVRLDAMVAFADRLGAAALATGHYARLHDDRLRLAEDREKDQTYMLAATPRTTLARLRFPLGDLRKDQVRALAGEAGLSVADKPDSQDLCFLAGTTRAAFLSRHAAVEDRPGDVVDLAGNVLGRHSGQHNFTVGQRRGLGIASTAPRYVLAKDADRNTVTVGERDELATFAVRVRDLELHGEPEAVKLRYRTVPVACSLKGEEIRLAEPVDGAAPGQTAVFLAGDLVVGTATIA
jgi:tRNA-specific 2-thiouridylase